MGKRKSPNKDHKFCPHCGGLTERFLSLKELAELTSMSIEYWRKRVETMDIDHVHFGRSVRIPYSAIKSEIRIIPAINTQTIDNLEYT
jgi:hypothetical protein